jgi:hypothetical protein
MNVFMLHDMKLFWDPSVFESFLLLYTQFFYSVVIIIITYVPLNSLVLPGEALAARALDEVDTPGTGDVARDDAPDVDTSGNEPPISVCTDKFTLKKRFVTEYIIGTLFAGRWDFAL